MWVEGGSLSPKAQKGTANSDNCPQLYYDNVGESKKQIGLTYCIIIPNVLYVEHLSLVVIKAVDSWSEVISFFMFV